MGFEAMPQIADLEIAATWDEIELEAALRGQAGDAPIEPAAEPPACLADALRAIEALKQLPKEERKRRAEELLRALTSAPIAPSPDAETTAESSAPVAVQASPSEPIVELAVPAAEESVGAAPVTASVEPSESALGADAMASADPIPDSPPIAELVAVSSEISESEAEEVPSADAAPVPVEPMPEYPVAAEPVAPSMEISEPTATEVPSPEEAVATSPEVAPEPLEMTEAVAATPAPEPVAVEATSCAADAPIITEAVPEAAAACVPVIDPVVEAAPVAEAKPDPVARAVVAAEPDAIPKFLTTECTALEPEQPDSLIPFRTVAAAGALIGAVLLVYFWSSQEFGVAARPIIGATETSELHAVAPKMSASLAARRGFVASPPEFASGPQPVRPRRPALVGFDLFDDPAPTPAVAVSSTAAPMPAHVAPVAPQPSAGETTALPPDPSSDIEALIKRGDDLLKAGDVAAARSAYERAAAGGNAKAQIGVGRTYDPLVLSKLGARGVRGDPVQAAAWYARAGESGDEEGQQRLHALITGLSDCMLAQGTCASRKP